MKKILRHPVWNGLAFEGLLVVLFCIFPAGACNSPPVGVAVLVAHYPATLFLEWMFHIGFSAKQAILSVVIMTPVWIVLFVLLKWIFVRRVVTTNGQQSSGTNGGRSAAPVTHL